MTRSGRITTVGLACIIACCLVGYSFEKNKSAQPQSAKAQIIPGDQRGAASVNDGTHAENGIKYKVIREGYGLSPQPGQTVTVHYTGWFTDGKKFDSSVDRGQPFLFTYGQGEVIKGWERGLQTMHVGEKRRLTIPPELAYGERGAGGLIPRNSTLIFDVELLECK